MPVELTSFYAAYNSNVIQLTWQTAAEVSNYGFEIEKSLTPAPSQSEAAFEKIGFVTGSGNSNSPKNYKFEDNNLFGGSRFSYRLKQIDNDGGFAYSDVIDVEIVLNNYELLQNYPNPFNPLTIISYSIPHKSFITIKVFDPLGSLVDELVQEEKEAGKYEVGFNAFNLTSGVYFYRIEADDFTETKKMIFLR